MSVLRPPTPAKPIADRSCDVRSSCDWAGACFAKSGSPRTDNRGSRHNRPARPTIGLYPGPGTGPRFGRGGRLAQTYTHTAAPDRGLGLSCPQVPGLAGRTGMRGRHFAQPNAQASSRLRAKCIPKPKCHRALAPPPQGRPKNRNPPRQARKYIPQRHLSCRHARLVDQLSPNPSGISLESLTNALQNEQ